MGMPCLILQATSLGHLTKASRKGLHFVNLVDRFFQCIISTLIVEEPDFVKIGEER